MKHKKLLFITFLIFLFASCSSTKDASNSTKKGKEKIVLISTNYGDMKVKLYNETPIHRDNFLTLVEQGFYDSLIFHRVINKFMIQGGDPDTRLNKTETNDTLSQGAKTLPAEFVKTLFHKKGALAAARMGDDVNPQKESSPYQFYIVHGQVLNDDKLAVAEKRSGHTVPNEHKAIYKTLGGTPHLDQNYTVFGEVIEGIYVIDKIAAVETAKANVPIKDVIMTMKVVKK